MKKGLFYVWVNRVLEQFSVLQVASGIMMCENAGVE
jgi:hypothetical protein